jgi:hypothetical protein
LALLNSFAKNCCEGTKVREMIKTKTADKD